MSFRQLSLIIVTTELLMERLYPMIWLPLCLKDLSRLILSKKKTKGEYFEHTGNFTSYLSFYKFIFLKTRVKLVFAFTV